MIRGNRIYDNSVGIFTLGVDFTSTTITHNFFAPGVPPIVTG